MTHMAVPAMDATGFCNRAPAKALVVGQLGFSVLRVTAAITNGIACA